MSRDSKPEMIRRVLYAARANEAAVDRFDQLAAEALGINRTDARCLDIVDNEGGAVTAGRLAELSGLTTAAITTVIDRLEAKGYVKRVRDEKDRRRVLVEQTPLLRERTQVIWGPLAAEAAKRFKDVTTEQMQTLVDYFEMSRAVNEQHAERIRGLRFD